MNCTSSSVYDDDIKAAQRDYIVPYCSNIDPANPDGLPHTPASGQNAFKALDTELDRNLQQPILVLADSGMGKTSLLLNLLGREQAKRPKKQRPIVFVPLGRVDDIAHIGSIENSTETILLLDGFDQDARAIEDAGLRMQQLMAVSANFRAVVITCQTPFFHASGLASTYPWLAVTLLPFDVKQLNQFIRSAIPWGKSEQRRKAKQIICQMPDLVCHPMFAALIPELASTDVSVRSLWDWYAFMLDSWVQRERRWIDPESLKQLSQILAVDLVLKRSTRPAQRISHADLLQLLALPDQAVKGWILTGRSLLTIDADGCYLFAHQLVMEFLFIKALIEGDKRCIGVSWTDTMRELFFSWGGSANYDAARAQQILGLDLRKTGLFPLANEYGSVANLDAAWVQKTFADSASQITKPTFPAHWRKHVSRVVDAGDVARAYDLAQGLVWQIQKTTMLKERGDRDIYKVDRYSHSGESHAELLSWAVPNLFQLRSLVETLALSNCLAQVLDERELYWLADTDGRHCALARVRSNVASEPVAYSGLTLVHGVSGQCDGIEYAVDVYKADLRGTKVSSLLALPIMTAHDDVQRLWHGDHASASHADWSISLLNTKKSAFDFSEPALFTTA